MDQRKRLPFGKSLPDDLRLIFEDGRASETTSPTLAASAMARLKDRYSFYHKIQLNDNLYLPGRLTGEQEKVQETIPKVVRPGHHVLDIGARDGLFCVEANRWGAKRIVACDNDSSEIFTDIV